MLGSGVNAQGVTFPGGLDLATPTLRLPPGALQDVINFEVAPFGGYTRTAGYERTDGQLAPSAATFQVIQLSTLFVTAPPIGAIVTQAVTLATGKVVAVFQFSSPNTFSAYLVVTMVTGTFDASHVLTFFSGVTQTVGTAALTTVSLDPKTSAIYTAGAADAYRALILKPPGAGPILGVVAMAFLGVDQLFAFRANVGNTAAVLWKATPAGWVVVPYLNIVSFTAGGTAVPLDGDTLTQGAVTATIRRVMWQSGSWTGTAVGQFVVTNPAGGNFAAGAATTSSGATITLSGVQTAITMAAGGKFSFTKCNFSGQARTRRIYGADGANQAFEFDGVTLAPIKTGLTLDRPLYIYFHKQFLFVAQGSSLIYCGAGTPFKWSAIDGGGEIAMGDIVTGMVTLPGSQTTAVLAVFMAANSAFLYGTDPTTFNLVIFNQGIGAAPYSMQNLFDTFFLDSYGVVTLRTTQNYGNFVPTSLTKNILSFIARERGNITASSVNRERSQYRIFYKDGYMLPVTVLNTQYLGCGLVLYPDPMVCVDTTNLTTGSEATYAGSTSGYVYRLDIGTSFDGGPINAYITPAWDAAGSPRILKRYRAASLEIRSPSYAEVQMRYDLGYNSNLIGQDASTNLPINLGDAPYWDSFTWDAFTWDSGTITPSDVSVNGTAENIRFTIASGTNYMASYTLASVIYHYSMRRGLRV